MYQGNWQCSSCGGSITELPFEPRSEKGLTCRACFMKQKDGTPSPAAAPEVTTASAADDRDDAPPFDPEAAPGDAAAPTPPEFTTAAAPTEKQSFTGEWPCSVCGGTITSLPFEPRSTANLKCIDCFKQTKS